MRAAASLLRELPNQLKMLASALRFTGLIAILVGSLAEAENTTCAGNALDWYSDAVGETPCR